MKNHRHFFTCVALLGLLPATFAQTETNATKAPEAEIPAVGRLPDTDDGLPGAGPIRRYEWFRKLWQARRVAWSHQVEKDQGAVVFLGDSITQGWGDFMGNSFPGLKVANRGISGDTTRGVLIRMKEDVLAVRPRAVVILIGTNDLEEKADPETIAGNMKLILAALKAFDANMPIILCEVFPSSASKKRPKEKITKVNELYSALVSGDPQVTLVDTWTIFADENGDAKAGQFPDLLHPNKDGYQVWAGVLQPVFKTLELTLGDGSQAEEGFTSLFNGKDLTGWGYRTNNFDGMTESSDARYTARHGELVVNPFKSGVRLRQLSTTREFPKDFELKLEFHSAYNADSGIFIRGPQLQCRDYLVAGPYKQLKKYKALGWNEIDVVVKNNVAHCTCNGEVLEDALAIPATGPIGLEADRSQMEYRNIRIKELP